jgi:hypothetical protein
VILYLICELHQQGVCAYSEPPHQKPNFLNSVVFPVMLYIFIFTPVIMFWCKMA